MFEDISSLYYFNQWWTFFFLMLYVPFLQYVFMNTFTSIFFEEQRLFSLYEDAIYHKFPHLRRTRILCGWFSGFWVCCARCTRGRTGKKKEEEVGELEVVNELRERMRQRRRRK